MQVTQLKKQTAMITVDLKGCVYQFQESEKDLSFSEFEKKHKFDNYAPLGKDEVWKALTGKKSTIEDTNENIESKIVTKKKTIKAD